jgi:hypothetical protein
LLSTYAHHDLQDRAKRPSCALFTSGFVTRVFGVGMEAGRGGFAPVYRALGTRICLVSAKALLHAYTRFVRSPAVKGEVGR